MSPICYHYTNSPFILVVIKGLEPLTGSDPIRFMRPTLHLYHNLVAGSGFEPLTSRLWALQATSALPRYLFCWLKWIWTLILRPFFEADARTPFCCAPLHHNQSRVSNLSGTELITLGLCSYDRSRTCIRYVTSCCSYQGRFHREQGSCYSLFTTPFI